MHDSGVLRNEELLIRLNLKRSQEILNTWRRLLPEGSLGLVLMKAKQPELENNIQQRVLRK